jgi:hypothetical protein
MKEIEKIIEELGSYEFWEHAIILDLLKQAYNAGLQDAVELSKLKYYAGETGYLNEESILKLKLTDGTSKK